MYAQKRDLENEKEKKMGGGKAWNGKQVECYPQEHDHGVWVEIEGSKPVHVGLDPLHTELDSAVVNLTLTQLLQ